MRARSDGAVCNAGERIWCVRVAYAPSRNEGRSGLCCTPPLPEAAGTPFASKRPTGAVPCLEMTVQRFEAIIPLAALRQGRMKACVLGGREIVLCNTSAGVFAVDNVCTHAYARMSEGRLRGTRLICPMHGASFDVRDGRVLGPPAERPLAVHALRIVGGIIEVAVDP